MAPKQAYLAQLVDRLDTLAKRQEDFAQEIARLRLDIQRLTAAEAKQK
ncbi:MAG: hypothetical protein AAF804_16790 [Bacteroidota bacterium]